MFQEQFTPLNSYGNIFLEVGPSRFSRQGTQCWLSYFHVIDMLLFKGMEELMNIVNQSKQRHHIVGQYVVGNQGLVQDVSGKDRDASNFLKKFYSSNYS
ncbi:hypothetical protein KY284_000946 [Solanum tuberosum]|nr:hypothetical protein KY284_000946 [Solanum tuberosum]